MIATMEGLYLQDGNTGTTYHKTVNNSELEDNRLISVHYDSKNRLWLGSISAGTSVYEIVNFELVPVQEELELSKYKAVSFFEDSRDNVWIASEQGGLIKVSPGLDEKTVYTTEHGLPNNSVTDVTEAPAGTYWITTLKGFSRFDYNKERFYNYTISHGLPSLVFNRGAIINNYDDNGKLWLGTESGLVSFSPDEIEINKPVEKITITDFYVSGERYQDLNGNKPVEQIEQVVLKGNQSSIGFRFIALNYFNPNDNQYLYRLSEIDEKWLKSGDNYATYTNLKPGQYTFQVRLADADGLYETEISSLVVQVKPLWYQLTILQVILGIIILVLIIIAVKAIIDLKSRVKKLPDLKEDDSKETYRKYETSSLSAEKSIEIEYLLKNHVEESKIYLNSELKLKDLAAAINCSPHDVSQVINQNLNQSYYEFINCYRVEAVKKCMTDPAYKKYTLLAIAQECGFNSKTSFYRAFKKLSGVTPIQYQNKLTRSKIENQ